MLLACVSAEKIIKTRVDNLPSLAAAEKNREVSSSGRFDINIILNRARKIKEKETLTNRVFIGLTLSLIFVVGLILSY